MVEHGLVVSVSFAEADDFDNGPVLAAINALVEALKDCAEVSVSISSEYVDDNEEDLVQEDADDEFADDQEDDEADESEHDAEDASEDTDADAEHKEDDLH